MKHGSCIRLEELRSTLCSVFVSPAKQKRDICTAFPAASLMSSAAAA